MSKGNRPLAVRLLPELRASVESAAKAYGANPSVFVRDLLGATVMGDLSRMRDFQNRLQRGFIQQMTLALPEDKVGEFRQFFTAAVGKGVQDAGRVALRASKQSVRLRKGGRQRARP